MAGSPASLAPRLTPRPEPHPAIAPAATLSADESALLLEYRAWRDANRVAGRPLTVMVRVDIGPMGDVHTDGRAQRGSAW